ncbi:uncharacterized protein V6R79_013362 [Siganus canaliculatus]
MLPSQARSQLTLMLYELTKIASLIEALKNSLESRFDTIETTVASQQMKHNETKRRLGDIDDAMPVKINRAHLSLRPNLQPDERPGVIIAKVHNDRDVVDILRLSRQQALLHYHGASVSIFTPWQRQAFAKVKRWRVETGAKCSLRFQVNFNNTTKMFLTPAEAERFGITLDTAEES